MEIFIPFDIILEIKKYLPVESMYVLNKSKFLQHYPFIIHKYSTLNKRLFNKYVLNMINKDCILQFKLISELKVTSWRKVKRWKFNKKIYSSYIDFLREQCINRNSHKCLNYIRNYMYFTSLNKKTHKNMGIKNIKWNY